MKSHILGNVGTGVSFPFSAQRKTNSTDFLINDPFQSMPTLFANMSAGIIAEPPSVILGELPLLKKRKLTEEIAVPQLHADIIPQGYANKTFKMKDLMQELHISKQGDLCQLKKLLKMTISPLYNLILPRSRGNFTCFRKDGKNINLPKFFRISNVRYSYSSTEEVYLGGFSFVAFYTKSKGKLKRKCDAHDIDEKLLPERVALKVTRVDILDFKSLHFSNYSAEGTTIGWLREFLVQTKLKNCFRESDLPIADMFASGIFRLTQTNKRLQVFSVLEAGDMDFYSYFLNISRESSLCYTFDLTRRYRMLKLMYEAARSLQKLHDIGLQHGDVKLSNILVDREKTRAVFIDFDGSVFMSEDVVCDTYTKEYISPQRSADDESFDALKDDCWALGICFLKIVTRQGSPFREISMSEIRNFDIISYTQCALSNSVLPYCTQLSLNRCISKLLAFSENERATAREVASLLEREIG